MSKDTSPEDPRLTLMVKTIMAIMVTIIGSLIMGWAILLHTDIQQNADGIKANSDSIDANTEENIRQKSAIDVLAESQISLKQAVQSIDDQQTEQTITLKTIEGHLRNDYRSP